MIKKIFFYYIIIIVIFLELFLQFLPIIYKNLQTYKEQDNICVFVFGQCVPFGYPYQGKVSFQQIITYVIDNKIDNKSIKIVNLSDTKKNILYQYLKYYKYKILHPYDKGIIFCYMLKDVNNLENKINDYNTFKNILKRINLINIPMIYFNQINDFYTQYDTFLYLTNKFGDKIYVSTILGNYSGVMPNNVDSLIKNKNLKEQLQIIDELILNGNYDNALKQSEDLLNIYKEESQILYRIGKIYEKQKKIKEANKIYESMITFEDLRPSIEENKIIRNLVKKYNFELIDIAEKIENTDTVIGYNYFLDLSHPTIDFDIFVAQEFINKIQQNFQIEIVNKDIKNTILSSLSDQDWFIVYKDSIGEIFYYSYYKKVIFDVYNKEIISKYISNLYEFHNKIQDKNTVEFENREQIIHICETLFEYIQGNKQKTIELINKYNLKDIIFKRGEKGKDLIQCWWYMKVWLMDFIIENKKYIQ